MSSSNPIGDPRPNRFIELFLSKNYEIDLFFKGKKEHIKNYKLFNKIFLIENSINWSSLKIPKVIFTLISATKFIIKNNPTLPPIYYERLYPLSDKQFKDIKNLKYDFIIVEDIVLLTQAIKFADYSKVIFDAREFYEAQSTESLKFRFLIAPIRVAILNFCLPKCDHIFTVSESIAKAYERKYSKKISVLRNIPTYRDFKVKKIDPERINIVHHGIGYKTRGIKDMIDIANSLDERFHLDLYLVATDKYIDEINLYLGNSKKVSIRQAVSYEKIIGMLSNYDIGLFFVKPITFNLLNCLPNKLFEFIQARLAVAIGPSPEMAKIVKRYNCGFISNSFDKESMINLLNNLDSNKIINAKIKSDLAANQLCFENESKNLIKILNKNH
tara:strand:- start:208 stop:1365 length:1158 start_codon:yes stop_codon:yes gene_type:complete